MTSHPGFGSYQLVERTIFEASLEQKKMPPEFVIDPKRDSNQSPLDVQL